MAPPFTPHSFSNRGPCRIVVTFQSVTSCRMFYLDRPSKNWDVELNWYMEGVHLDYLVQFLGLFPLLTELSIIIDVGRSPFKDVTTQAPKIQLPHIRNLMVKGDYRSYPNFFGAIAPLCAQKIEVLSVTFFPAKGAIVRQAISSFLSHGKTFETVKVLCIKINDHGYHSEVQIHKPLALILDKFERPEDLASAAPDALNTQSEHSNRPPFTEDRLGGHIRIAIATHVLHVLEGQGAIKSFSNFRSNPPGTMSGEKLIGIILESHGIVRAEY